MKHKRKIGILGGSFNPVHIGHILLADYLVQFTDLDEVHLMLSPLNPLKTNPGMLADDADRLEMLKKACCGMKHVCPCDIELSMPKPNYSINSLNLLAKQNPDAEIRLVIGSDNWNIFNRWRDYETIIERFNPIVYPRPGHPVDKESLPENVTLIKAPTFDISSTFLRDAIANGHDMKLFLPDGVWDYIKSNKLYGYGNTVTSTDT